MKRRFKYIRPFTGVILLFILTNQIMWIYNMYNVYRNTATSIINSSLQKAVFMEINERYILQGGVHSITFSDFQKKIESTSSPQIITRTIQLSDTTFNVQIDAQDPLSELKIMQYILQDLVPMDLNRVDTLLQRELNGQGLSADTYIEFINLKTNKVIYSTGNPSLANSEHIVSEIIPVDILDNNGVKIYIASSTLAIIKRMGYQLALSILLIIVAGYYIFELLNTIYAQRKEEKMRQEAISAMTHEFKRPISAAVSQTAMIQYWMEKGEHEKAYKYAQRTMNELNKLSAYTQRIQRISVDDKAAIRLDLEQTNIKDFFNTLIRRHERLYKHEQEEYAKHGIIYSKNIVFALEIETKRETMIVDQLHFSNVMDNLIENAIKYSKDELRIQIHVSDEKNSLKISVKDNGIGISRNEIEHIFDKFFRGTKLDSYRKTGFGMGLTYVKSILEELGATIEVKSEEGIGSEFIILLPIERHNN